MVELKNVEQFIIIKRVRSSVELERVVTLSINIICACLIMKGLIYTSGRLASSTPNWVGGGTILKSVFLSSIDDFKYWHFLGSIHAPMGATTEIET